MSGHSLGTGPLATIEALERDPYPLYREMLAREPIAYIESLKMWWAVRHDHVEAILRDDRRFAVGGETSPIRDVFGDHMLTLDGAEQERHRRPFRSHFAPARIRSKMTEEVRSIATALIDGFADKDSAELRSQFASRLPILTILALFGIGASEEARFRRWFDLLEHGLANFTGDRAVRDQARIAAGELRAFLHDQIECGRDTSRDDLLSLALNDIGPDRLSDQEIVRNASIIFFGAISTVEALILNTLYALGSHPVTLAEVACDPKLIPAAVDETMRWLSPVQSATRLVVEPVTIGGVELAAGSIVNCMLGGANRDPQVFEEPDRFRPERPGIRRQLGFAVGPHFCLGSGLAKLEAEVAIDVLFARYPAFRLAEPEEIKVIGYEFRQPKSLLAEWR